LAAATAGAAASYSTRREGDVGNFARIGSDSLPAFNEESAFSNSRSVLPVFSPAPQEQPSAAPGLLSPAGPDQRGVSARGPSKAPSLQGLPNQPQSLTFEANRGQFDAQVRFLARGPGYTLSLNAQEAVLSFEQPDEASGSAGVRPAPAAAVVHLGLVGGNPAPRVIGVDRLPGEVNYLQGNDRSQWHTHIPTYARVEYQEVYPGVNLDYYSNQGQLEYDFVVAPGANPAGIALSFQGADQVAIDAQGDLVLQSAGRQFSFPKPVLYQEVNGHRQTVPGGYVFTGARQVGFAVGSYNAGLPLVIDPRLQYFNSLLGTAENQGLGIAVDAYRNSYLTGYINLGTTHGRDVFVTKLNDEGDLVYTTIFGGQNDDVGEGIAVDAQDRAYVIGYTESTDFPIQNPLPGFNFLHGARNAFVSRLTDGGFPLDFSTYLGGMNEDEGRGIALDGNDNIYLTGITSSSDFPIRNPLPGQDRLQGSANAFVTKINLPQTGNPQIIYSTYLGGTGRENIDFNRFSDLRNLFRSGAIAADRSGNAYVTGTTTSSDFPTQNPLPGQDQLHGDSDAFVTKLSFDPMGMTLSLAYSTYLGGDRTEEGNGIAIDASGQAYVTGATASTNFPTRNPYQDSLHRGATRNAFVTILNQDGSDFVYSTYLGGEKEDVGYGITVDAQARVYVTGKTASTDFPIKDPLRDSTGMTTIGDHLHGDQDAFVTKLDPSMSPGNKQLFYSTYLSNSVNPRWTVGYGIAKEPVPPGGGGGGSGGNGYPNGCGGGPGDGPSSCPTVKLAGASQNTTNNTTAFGVGISDCVCTPLDFAVYSGGGNIWFTWTDNCADGRTSFTIEIGDPGPPPVYSNFQTIDPSSFVSNPKPPQAGTNTYYIRAHKDGCCDSAYSNGVRYP
jgi:hypothetical protein